MESLSEAIVDPGRGRAFHALRSRDFRLLWSGQTVLMELLPESVLSRVISLDCFGSLGLTPVGYALAAGLSDLYSPSQILVAGFGLSAVSWLAPLTISRVRNAA